MSSASSAATAPLELPLPGGEGRYVVRGYEGPAAAPAAGPARSPAFDPYLFLEPAHLDLQPAPGPWLLLELHDERRRAVLARLPVFAPDAEGLALSPWQGTFGAAQLAPHLPPALLRSFCLVVHQVLAARGVRRLRLRCPPQAYAPSAAATLHHTLTQLGYETVATELNQHLPLQRDFEAHLHPSERRRLHKCRRLGFHFEQEPPYLLPAAYELLRQCRAEKGQPLTLPLARVQELFAKFPREHGLFSVRDAAGNWAAITVAIRINGAVLYNFYPASPLAYNAYSPMVLLLEGLVAHARANGQELLDLGTCTEPTAEGLSDSLFQFKRHVGCENSLKLTLEGPVS